ncbi:MAG: tRNA pseudouridine(55) synthase TruB [Alphaproteobacteria bacterium]|nr:tRNA pseudouridine(55) synthase TruB [Alphaproteobacteria bacterium]
MLNGFINFYKESGLSSNDALYRIKRLLFPEFGKVKIGFVGTLDPLAEGVLPIALGEATKLLPYITDGRKTYVFNIKFGAETTTADRGGEVVATSDKIPMRDEILAAVASFRGAITQVPPKYSAIQIGGRRAYDLAREGVEFEIKSRSNFVHEFELLGQAPYSPKGSARSAAPTLDARGIHRLPPSSASLAGTECEWQFRITADTGFYVRSMACDLARAVGSLGYASYIYREASGAFEADTAISLDKLAKMFENTAKPDARDFILDLCFPLNGILEEKISEEVAVRLRHGMSVEYVGLDGIRKVILNGSLVAIAEIRDGRMYPVRVINN